MKKARKKIAKLPIINLNAAGIDIGATQIFVAVPPDRDQESVRCFGTFTADLEKLAYWFEACNVQTAAMDMQRSDGGNGIDRRVLDSFYGMSPNSNDYQYSARLPLVDVPVQLFHNKPKSVA